MIFELTPGIVLGVIGITLYKVLELYAHRKERLNVIERLSETNFSDGNKRLNLNLFAQKSSSFSSLKIGLLLIGVGLGCLVGILIQSTCTDSLLPQFHQFDGEVRENISNFVSLIYFASISTFGGLGLVAAYLIEKNDKKND